MTWWVLEHMITFLFMAFDHMEDFLMEVLWQQIRWRFNSQHFELSFLMIHSQSSCLYMAYHSHKIDTASNLLALLNAILDHTECSYCSCGLVEFQNQLDLSLNVEWYNLGKQTYDMLSQSIHGHNLNLAWWVNLHCPIICQCPKSAS